MSSRSASMSAAAQREQLFGPDAREERREDERPVAGRDGVEQLAGFLGRDPAALGALARRLQPGVGRVDACAQRRVDLDAVLAQRVAEDRGEAADRAVDRRLRQAAREQRGCGCRVGGCA